jgi:hypothetical protein
MENRTNIPRDYGRNFLMFLFLYVMRFYKYLKRRLTANIMIVEIANSVVCRVRNRRKEAEHGGEQEGEKDICT